MANEFLQFDSTIDVPDDDLLIRSSAGDQWDLLIKQLILQVDQGAYFASMTIKYVAIGAIQNVPDLDRVVSTSTQKQAFRLDVAEAFNELPMGSF